MTPTVQFIHGDCLEVLPTLPKGSVDMCFLDLPYGELSWKHWDVPLDLSALWAQLSLVCSRQAANVATCSLRFAHALLTSNLRNFSYDLVYEKHLPSNPFLANKRPMPCHELILVFGECKTYNPQMSPESERANVRSKKWQGKPINSSFYEHTRNNGTRMAGAMYPRSVLRGMSGHKLHNIHATQKPISLLRWLIKSYSNPGDTILDPTAGSGTTAVAALLEGRHSISIEKDPVIFANARERVMAVQRSLVRK